MRARRFTTAAARLRPCIGDTAGSAVVETALALPILLVMLAGLVNYAMGFAHTTQLQQFAQSGADMVVAGDLSPPNDAAIKSQIAAISGLPQSAVTITRWTECNYLAQASVQACTGTGVARADYIKIQVADTYTPALALPAIFPQSATSASAYATARLP